MASIALGSMNTGLPKDIVQRLVEAEREPIKQLEARKMSEQSRLKLVNDLATKISDISASIKDLTRYRSFRELSASVGRPELLDVSVDKSVAEPGTYQLEVMQLAGQSSMMSNGFEDPDDTQVGAGYFSYSLPSGETKEVYIDPDNSTLQGIARSINGQKDLELQALVVNDGSGSDEPWRLIVNHTKTGEANDAEFPNFYFVDGDADFEMDQERPAMNSKLRVNGFEVEFEGNKITSLLPGVTLDLKDAAPGKQFTLGIKEDTKSMKGKVEAMVAKINEVLTFVQTQNKLDKDTNTRNTLGGDVTLQTLEYKIRTLVQTPLMTEEGPARLADFGVVFNRNGLLDFSGDKLDKVLNTNSSLVTEFFAGAEDGTSEGFAAQLANTVKALSQDNGLVHSRLDGIKRRIADIDHQIETKETQIARTEENLKEKFAKLEGTMANLKAQQASVAGSLGGGGALPGLG